MPPAGPPPAAQAVWTVNSTNDPGDGTCDQTECTLREAINASASGDTVDFSDTLAGATITLISGYLYLDVDLTIDASGLAEQRVTISGNNASPIFFHPTSPGTLLLKNLRIVDGHSTDWGGCIYTGNSDFTLEDCELVHCVKDGAGSGGGAILSNSGTLTLIRTRIADSSANNGTGGGVYAGGARLRVIDSTFENNQANLQGAALSAGTTTTISGSLFVGNTGGGQVVYFPTGTISNTTFSGNHCDDGVIVAASGDNLTLHNVTVAYNGGYGVKRNPSSTLHIIHSIIANNTPHDCDIFGGLTTNIKNMDSDGTCNVEYPNRDPLLGPLADNGGETWTHALLSGSPAIDAGDNAYCPATDQRGVERPKDGDDNGTAVCDIGAFELSNELDYGDAPATYPTLKADDGARHYLRTGFFLGAQVDSEPDGFPSSGADGDDTNNFPDDEDGVTFRTPLRTNDTAVVEVVLSHAGYVHAWLDFNADGDWADAGEKFIPGLYRPAGAQRFTFTVPLEAQLENTYARFRFASRPRLSYSGIAVDGEVEDYKVTIARGRPVARPDTAGLDENSSLLLDVLANDFDPHGTVALQSVGSAARGATAIEEGKIRYTPNLDYNGSDAFFYTIINDLGLTQTARVALLVRNVNSTPKDIQIFNQQPLIATCDASNLCTLPADTLVGTLYAVDPDPGDTHTFNLLDSGEFRLSGAVLYTRRPIAFTGNTQTVQRVVQARATDAGNLSFDKSFTLFILGDRVGGGPEAILLSDYRVQENLPAGTVVGTLSTQEETPHPPYVYSLVSGQGSNDNAKFKIVGDQLQTVAPLDFEQKELNSVRVRTLSSIGQFKDAVFTIQLLDDTSEPPAPPPNCSGANIELLDSGDVEMSVINITASNVSLKGCDITGELVLSIPGWLGSGFAFAGKVNERNQLTAQPGQIAPIAMQVAGVPLRVDRPSLESYDGRPGLRLERASFCLPAEWGGLCAPAQAGGVSMLIDDGGLKVGGGLKIGFPEIRVGNQLNLSGLSGGLKPVPGGYEIVLAGEFGLPKFKPGGAGGCGISASVTIYVGAAGELVMEIRTQPPAPDAVRLREISIGLACQVGIPIDNTGLALTGVAGTVTLQPDAQSVSLTLTVTSIAKVPGLGLSLIRGDGTATLSWEPTWGLDLVSIVRLLEIFTVAQTHIGVRENGFSFTANVNSFYINGSLRINAWTDWARLHLAGRGQVDVGLREGSVYHGCIDLWFCEVCISIPPFDLYVGMGAEFGEFTNRQWGVKGYVEVLGKRYGIYVDTRPSLHVGGVDQYQLVTPPQILAALAQWRAEQAAGAGPPSPAGDLYATAGNRVVLRVPVNVEPPALAPTGQITTPVELETQKDTLFALSSSEPLTMTLQAPDGTVITPDNYNQPPVFPTYTVQYTQVAYYQVGDAGEYTVSAEPHLRFVQAATHPDWQEVDLSLDGVLLFANQRLDTPAALYVPIYAGQHVLSVVPSGGGMEITATFSADPGTPYTALLSGDGATPDLSVLADDHAAPSAGMARLRFVHSAPHPGAVDVWVEGVQVLDDGAYLSASAYLEFAPGEVLVEVKDAASGDDVAPPQVVVLAEGDIHTLFDIVHPVEAYSLDWRAFLDQQYIGRYYAHFLVTRAPTGTWEVALEGNLDTALPMFTALGVANPPAWWYVEAQATDPFHPELYWQLKSDYLPTRVEVYANPGEYMDLAWVYQGYRIAELELTDPEDVAGNPFTYTVDLSGLESGDYSLWVRAEDGVNPAVADYALTGPYGEVAIFTIDQSATFPISWTPAITAVVSREQARLFLEWEALAHPDVDHYNLYVSTQPFSPTLHTEGLSAFRQTDESGQPFGPVLVNAGVSNLAPGNTYYYSVEAVDVEGGRSVRSPEAAVYIPAGDFRLNTPSWVYRAAPGTQMSLSLSLEVLEPLFYPNVGLSIDGSRTPPGMRVWFDTPLGGDAYLTEAESEVVVVVDLLDSVADGIYPITFVGANGEMRRGQTIYILVNPVMIYLPVVYSQYPAGGVSAGR